MVLHVFTSGLGLHGAGGTGEEAQVVDGEIELEVDDGQRLAHIGHLDGLEFVDVRLDAVGEGEERLGTGARRAASPFGEGAARRDDGVVDVGGVAGRNRGDDPAGGRCQDLVGGSAPRRHPFSADVVRVLHRISSESETVVASWVMDRPCASTQVTYV